MLSNCIESFRKDKGLTIGAFEEITGIPRMQIYRYESGLASSLQISDAIKLLAGFPEDIRVSVLCSWLDMPPVLDYTFPALSFSAPHGFYMSNKRIRNFIINTASCFFEPKDALFILGSFSCEFDIFSDSFIRSYSLPLFFSNEMLFSLMSSLRTIRLLQISDFEIPVNTVKKHLRRENKVSKFRDLCLYERKFNSHGIYFLSELFYTAAEENIELFLKPGV